MENARSQMGKPKNDFAGKDWLEAELADALDEDYELELSEPALSEEIRKIYQQTHPATIDRTDYFRHLLTLQSELIKLQDWVQHTRAKIIVIFEGRDSAGKGGVIKRITQRLNPRVCRAVALPAPTDREKTQWYFQRYVTHLPAGGEIVLFDRSWYTQELAPYSGTGERDVRIDGPPVLLSPNAARSIAIVLHELATNAAKYGALSSAHGRVDLEWTDAKDGQLNLRWTETGGPAVQLPTRQGFGGRIIPQMIGQLGGKTRFDWRAEGLICEITLAREGGLHAQP
jgi:Polyphosphate kinase 2 (PPK2)